MADQARIVIVTYCKDLKTLYGSLLVFDTIRVGFPTAQITVVDNGSIPDAISEIRACATAVGASFSNQAERAHEDWLESFAMHTRYNQLVFCDPDVIFWKSMEDIELPPQTLLAGRLIPTFYDGFSQTITSERFHTSLLILPNVNRLRGLINAQRQKLCGREFQPFKPTIYWEDGKWRRRDTCAGLYQWLKAFGLTHAFIPRELDHYDHLFCGTHFAQLATGFPPEVRAQLQAWHEQASLGDKSMLKGIWRPQQTYFESAHP